MENKLNGGQLRNGKCDAESNSFQEKYSGQQIVSENQCSPVSRNANSCMMVVVNRNLLHVNFRENKWLMF